MGTTQGLDGLERVLGSVAVGLGSSSFYVSAHRAIAKAGKNDAERLGGTFHVWRKSTKGKRAVKLGARTEADETSARIMPRPAGLYAIAEDGARSHGIPKLRTRTGRLRKRSTVLAWDGGTAFAAHVSHPGAPARRRWTHVRTEVEHEAPGIVDREVRRVLTETIGA